MKKAVFLDRDGVITKLVFNPKTGVHEAPHRVEDFEICSNVVKPLLKLKENGYSLFLISNQPDFAKGIVSLDEINNIHLQMHSFLLENGVNFTEYYYCYHHPEGVMEGYSGPCECRKPKPYFILKARDKYLIDLDNSWMIGDQDTDILCGQGAGLKTILIRASGSEHKRGTSYPDHTVDNLQQAVMIIINRRMNECEE